MRTLKATRPERIGEPTPERRRRSQFTVIPAVAGDDGTPAKAGVRVWRSRSTLETLLRRGVLEPRQALAGEHFAIDWALGVCGAREPAGGSVSASGWFYSEARLSALRRFNSAIAVLGNDAPLVVLICIGEPGRGDLSFTSLARRLGRSRLAVAILVKRGLNALADHYRMI